jgi:hypothetical protein
MFFCVLKAYLGIAAFLAGRKHMSSAVKYDNIAMGFDGFIDEHDMRFDVRRHAGRATVQLPIYTF